jgi:hypothetical protein
MPRLLGISEDEDHHVGSCVQEEERWRAGDSRVSRERWSEQGERWSEQGKVGSRER